MISLAVQGGAMRSIYCLGAVRALVDAGLAEQVRTVHTASAGCVSGVLLGAHLADPTGPALDKVRDELLDRLAGRRFVNPLRPWNVVDVDYLTTTMREVTGLSARWLAERGTVFEVGMTDARTGAPRYVDVAQGDDDELYQALRATMALPVLYPKRVVLDGRRYLDGGISDPLPLLRALRRSPDVVIAVSSVAQSFLGIELESPLERAAIRLTPFVLSADVKHLLLTRNPLAAASEALAVAGTVAGVRIIRIAPADQGAVGSRLETRRQRLLRLEEMGYTDGVRALAAAGELAGIAPGAQP
ncbi:patatin-like phospholipase family protein [Catellatospora vulcania]|uniref:patatin-like phospholipase family protein n=1 Tax=Catellatospora vulcania TaxID=1460450 RepID=UPI0012D4A68F|nr:patatin-like phospholipase family protein [Catellatospora vulcania]